MRTYSPKKDEIERKWWVVDASDIPLGRLSTVVARVLTGKNKPQWAPHVDTGDFVIVVNAKQTVLTGRKEEQKVYYRHSTHPGGLKQATAAEVRAKHPRRLVEKAVWGMLPKNKLGRRQLRKLKVYAGTEHPHEAQRPETLSVGA